MQHPDSITTTPPTLFLKHHFFVLKEMLPDQKLSLIVWWKFNLLSFLSFTFLEERIERKSYHWVTSCENAISPKKNFFFNIKNNENLMERTIIADFRVFSGWAPSWISHHAICCSERRDAEAWDWCDVHCVLCVCGLYGRWSDAYVSHYLLLNKVTDFQQIDWFARVLHVLDLSHCVFQKKLKMDFISLLRFYNNLFV